MKRLLITLAIVLLAVGGVYTVKKSRPVHWLDAPVYRQKGPRWAPVTIWEFSDFQCPACRSAVGPLKELMALAPDRIRLAFHHTPLEGIHFWARTAALAAECAGKQGKFWEMHDILFERQEDWNESPSAPEIMEGYAGEIGLDGRGFSACVKSRAAEAAIEQDKRKAGQLDIDSTPTFLINGKRFVGPGQLQREGPQELKRILRVRN